MEVDTPKNSKLTTSWKKVLWESDKRSLWLSHLVRNSEPPRHYVDIRFNFDQRATRTGVCLFVNEFARLIEDFKNEKIGIVMENEERKLKLIKSSKGWTGITLVSKKGQRSVWLNPDAMANLIQEYEDVIVRCASYYPSKCNLNTLYSPE